VLIAPEGLIYFYENKNLPPFGNTLQQNHRILVPVKEIKDLLLLEDRMRVFSGCSCFPSFFTSGNTQDITQGITEFVGMRARTLL